MPTPVDGDRNFALVRAALFDHLKDWNVTRDTAGYAFEDDVTPSGRVMRDGFLSSQVASLSNAATPIQLWGSWFDAGTAESALAWYAAAPTAPIEIYLGAWNHGGGQRVDPFLTSAAEDEPGAPSPARVFLDFAQHAVSAGATPARQIHYYTSGAAVWRTTSQWPPANVSPSRWYLAGHGGLSAHGDETDGSDRYAVDFTTTTGTANRWTTQMGGGPVAYGDRREADAHLLTYTSEPLALAIEITGAPALQVHLSSTEPDGALFAYLEAVAPDGAGLAHRPSLRSPP